MVAWIQGQGCDGVWMTTASIIWRQSSHDLACADIVDFKIFSRSAKEEPRQRE